MCNFCRSRRGVWSRRLEVLPLRGAMRPCAATLHVNHSLAMSGEQQSVEPPGLPPGLGGSGRNQSAAVPGRAALLYLGGLPGPGHALHPDQHDDLPLPGGLVGCMLGLEVSDDSPGYQQNGQLGIFSLSLQLYAARLGPTRDTCRTLKLDLLGPHACGYNDPRGK